MAEKKRKEYEEWLRAQEMEAYRLEYDCSVKYEEHQSEKKESKSEDELITNDFNHMEQFIFRNSRLSNDFERNPLFTVTNVVLLITNIFFFQMKK